MLFNTLKYHKSITSVSDLEKGQGHTTVWQCTLAAMTFFHESMNEIPLQIKRKATIEVFVCRL